MMKLCPTRFATAIAITVLLSKFVHLAMFKFMPDFYMKMHPFHAANFETWASFGIHTAQCVIAAFVFTWVAIALYDLMIKE